MRVPRTAQLPVSVCNPLPGDQADVIGLSFKFHSVGDTLNVAITCRTVAQLGVINMLIEGMPVIMESLGVLLALSRGALLALSQGVMLWLSASPGVMDVESDGVRDRELDGVACPHVVYNSLAGLPFVPVSPTHTHALPVSCKCGRPHLCPCCPGRKNGILKFTVFPSRKKRAGTTPDTTTHTHAHSTNPTHSNNEHSTPIAVTVARIVSVVAVVPSAATAAATAVVATIRGRWPAAVVTIPITGPTIAVVVPGRWCPSVVIAVTVMVPVIATAASNGAAQHRRQ